MSSARYGFDAILAAFGEHLEQVVDVGVLARMLSGICGMFGIQLEAMGRRPGIDHTEQHMQLMIDGERAGLTWFVLYANDWRICIGTIQRESRKMGHRWQRAQGFLKRAHAGLRFECQMTSLPPSSRSKMRAITNKRSDSRLRYTSECGLTISTPARCQQDRSARRHTARAT